MIDDKLCCERLGELHNEHKATMRIGFDSYEFLSISFGLINALITFMILMNNMFHDLLDRGVIVFLDDILIYSKTLNEHVILLRDVLKRLKIHRIIWKEGKLIKDKIIIIQILI